MDGLESQNSPPAVAQALHPGQSARRSLIEVVLPLLTFGAVGIWRCLQGDDAGFLFLGLIVIFIGLGIVGVVHRRRLPEEGPPDPSAQWRLPVGVADGGACMFRYGSGSIRAVWICALISLLFGPAIYFASNPRPSGSAVYGLAALGMLLSGAFFLCVRACERYGVEVTRTGIVHYRLRSPLTYSFQALGSVALLEGGGKGPKYVLALYDPQGRRVDQFPSTLDGFEKLVALVKERAFEVGLKYRYRDRWGSWTT